MTYLDSIEIVQPMAVPLSIVFIGLVILRELRQELRPIFVGMIGGLAEQSKSNAVVYGLCVCYFAAASLQAAADEFKALHWVVLAGFCKILQPGVVALLAYANSKLSPPKPANTP